NSPIGTSIRPWRCGDTWASETGGDDTSPQDCWTLPVWVSGGGASSVSTSVFQASHSGHLPIHRGVCAPQAWQTKTERAFVFVLNPGALQTKRRGPKPPPLA